jgi:hypothetical protein
VIVNPFSVGKNKFNFFSYKYLVLLVSQKLVNFGTSSSI